MYINIHGSHHKKTGIKANYSVLLRQGIYCTYTNVCIYTYIHIYIILIYIYTCMNIYKCTYNICRSRHKETGSKPTTQCYYTKATTLQTQIHIYLHTYIHVYIKHIQISPQGDGIKANYSVLLHQGNYSNDVATAIAASINAQVNIGLF